MTSKETGLENRWFKQLRKDYFFFFLPTLGCKSLYRKCWQYILGSCVQETYLSNRCIHAHLSFQNQGSGFCSFISLFFSNFSLKIFIGVALTSNVVLVSGVLHHGSVINHTHPFLFRAFSHIGYFLFFIFLVFLSFLWPLPRPMEVARLGVQSGL